MTRTNEAPKRPLRERVREAGGWYTWFNTNLIRVAGPPQVSPLEPGPSAEERAGSFSVQLRSSLARLRHPFLAWIFGYVILQTTLEHIPYEFMQPYLAAVLGGTGFDVANTPLATGVVVAVVALVGGWAAGLAPRVQRRLGTVGALLAITIIQTAIIAVLAAAVHPVIAALLLLRSVQPAIGHIIVNAAVAPRVPRRPSSPCSRSVIRWRRRRSISTRRTRAARSTTCPTRRVRCRSPRSCPIRSASVAPTVR